jgi:hypothetical protein
MSALHYILVEEPEISTHHLPDGRHVVKTDQFGAKIIAHVTNGAEDFAGKPRPIITLERDPEISQQSSTVTPQLKPVDKWVCVGYDELQAGICHRVG